MHGSAFGSLQRLAPLHTATPAHSSSGSAPDTMGPQVPFVPVPFFAAVHAWQVAVHAVLQHTPSTQKPLVHSASAAHAVPLAKSAQLAPPLHDVGPGHSLSGSVPTAMLPHVPLAPE